MYAGVLSELFGPDRKVAWNIRIPLITHQKQFETVQHDGELLSTRKNILNVDKTVARKNLIVLFVPRLSSTAHTVHSLLFCLRTPLIVAYNKILLQKQHFSGKFKKCSITSVDIKNTLIKLRFDKNRYIMSNSGWIDWYYGDELYHNIL